VSGLALSYSVDNFNLVADSDGAFSDHQPTKHVSFNLHILLQELRCCRSAGVEQSTVLLTTGPQIASLLTYSRPFSSSVLQSLTPHKDSRLLRFLLNAKPKAMPFISLEVTAGVIGRRSTPHSHYR